MVLRVVELGVARKVDPELDAVEQAALLDEPLRRRLDVQEPRSGRHPLGVAVGDGAATAVGVLVVEGAVDDVGDGLEAAVRVPGGALGLARRVVHLAHLVHHDERVELGEVDAGERAAYREPLALESLRRGRHAPHRTRLVAESGLAQPVQNGQVVNGDRGHPAHLLGSPDPTVVEDWIFQPDRPEAPHLPTMSIFLTGTPQVEFATLHAPVAQLAEQLTLNQRVVGSSPTWRTTDVNEPGSSLTEWLGFLLHRACECSADSGPLPAPSPYGHIGGFAPDDPVYTWPSAGEAVVPLIRRAEGGQHAGARRRAVVRRGRAAGDHRSGTERDGHDR